MAQIACVVCFWVGVPLLLAARVRRPSMPWWSVITFATALGWLAVNTAIYGQRRTIDAQIQEIQTYYAAAKTTVLDNAKVDTQTTETIVENPRGSADYWVLGYRPLGGFRLPTKATVSSVTSSGGLELDELRQQLKIFHGLAIASN